MRFRLTMRHALVYGLCLVMIAVLGVQMMLMPHQRAMLSLDYWRQVIRVAEAMRIVSTYYVDEQSASYPELTRMALSGMLSGLDPYSAYLTADSMRRIDEQSEQTYVGIGVEVRKMPRGITVMGVFPGSGAELAGMEIGDLIVGVDGVDTRSDTLSEIVLRLRGDEGTSVTLTVEREDGGELQELDKKVFRKTVNFPSLRDIEIDEDGIAYLRISHFGGDTASELETWLHELPQMQPPVQGLILDLRRNPGGTMGSVLDVLELFVAPGKKMLSATGRERMGRDHTWYAQYSAAVPDDLPIVVLVDRFTASAAEILAGVLQDHQRAVVMGEPTVGKGSIQSVFRFAGNAGFKLTTATYTLPNGRSIHDEGVTPDILMDEDEEDEQTADDQDIVRERAQKWLQRNAP